MQTGRVSFIPALFAYGALKLFNSHHGINYLKDLTNQMSLLVNATTCYCWCFKDTYYIVLCSPYRKRVKFALLNAANVHSRLMAPKQQFQKSVRLVAYTSKNTCIWHCLLLFFFRILLFINMFISDMHVYQWANDIAFKEFKTYVNVLLWLFCLLVESM